MITDFLIDAGYTIRDTPKTHYHTGIRHLLPDMTALRHFRSAPMLRLCRNAQLRKGKAYTYAQLRQIANPQAAVEPFTTSLRALVQYGLLRRGYQLTCPTCSLSLWYPLADVTVPEAICRGCHQAFLLPLDAPFAYAPNPLFTTALKSGMLCEWLALLAHQPLANDDWQAGILIDHPTLTTDIDLLIATDADAAPLLIECKDRIHDTQALFRHLESLQRLMEEFSVDIVFATLQETVPPLPAGVHILRRSHLLDEEQYS